MLRLSFKNVIAKLYNFNKSLALIIATYNLSSALLIFAIIVKAIISVKVHLYIYLTMIIKI